VVHLQLQLQHQVLLQAVIQARLHLDTNTITVAKQHDVDETVARKCQGE
jgi:hypothetical protein